MIFEETNKFLVTFVRLILGKVEVDGISGLQRKTDTRYDFGFKLVFLKDLL